MKTDNNGWISLKEQQPGEDQFPVSCGYWAGANWQIEHNFWHGALISGKFTHWIIQKTPPPPAKAKTQPELDADALANFKYHDISGPLTPTEHTLITASWNRGIAYERAEIAKICNSSKDDSAAQREIYSRVKGGI